jgi:DNA-directed RNA polymerase specialized sigma24 family protein
MSGRRTSTILVYFFEGRSYAEIAAALHLPENTVAPYLFRAKARMKKMMSA